MEEEYLPEYGPKWSDRRVERMLGALVCAVVGLLLALIVTVFVRAWPSFAHTYRTPRAPFEHPAGTSGVIGPQ